MRCNKCGEEYKDNQAFCLKCGNPIHVVPDFNLIEAELANDVGALMDSEDEEKNHPKEFDDASAMKTVNVPVEDISMELKMVDVNRGRFNFQEDDLRLEEEEKYFSKKSQGNRQVGNSQMNRNVATGRTVSDSSTSRTVTTNNGNGQPGSKRPANSSNTKNSTNKNVNSKKSIVKNVFIMLGCIVAVAFVVVILKKVVFSESLNDSNNFKEQYNIAKEYYDNNEKSKAIEESKKAVKVAYSTAEVLRARKLLHDVYVHFEVLDTEYEENLLKIVELESNNKYNEALLDYYYTNKRFEEFNTFFATLESKGTTETMEKYLPAKPVVNYEGGHYDTFLTIELTAAEGTKIFYTLDGKEPKNNENAFEYGDPISLNTESTTVILAYAKDANGIMSKTMEVEYVIEDVEVSGPVVTPSSGVYKEYQMITVTAPEGSVVYYTTDGSEPTAASTPYTEPFDMPYGRSDFKFVCIDASGNSSNITSVTYNLSLERTVKIAAAQTLVKDKCIKEKELDEDAKNKDGVLFEFKYKDIVVIDNAEYYIIEVSAEDDSVDVEYYAVHTNAATVVLATSTEEGYTIPEDTE